ncbi:HAD hydrolase family protein, partial [Candidatus Shapirobacteria bacterium]|nr:HAD hydrolase family protein [Candidatus Shapirobacteria bacterium]
PLVDQLVADSDPERQFYCWWNEEAYDINPKKFTKSIGLNRLLSIKNIRASDVLTVGNGVNDRDLVGASINISTNPSELQTDDFFVEGEEVGTLQILDRLLQLTHDQN